MARFLDGETEDWMEQEVEQVMARYEDAGNPIKGGQPIVELMRAAYQRGRASEQIKQASI